jgi:hypothetical protein
MANSDKNIVITPSIGSTTAQPTVVFTGQNAVPITLRVTDSGAISWEGSVGQLFSITNSLTGTLFSVNDISGLPALSIDDTLAINTYGPITGAAGTTVLNDISNLCDGDRMVFDLKQDQTILGTGYLVDSKDIEVVVDGRKLTPFVTPQTYPWLTVYDGSKGFRVRENRVIIYNAPAVGSEVAITMRKTSATKQKMKYPFCATTIVLGD